MTARLPVAPGNPEDQVKVRPGESTPRLPTGGMVADVSLGTGLSEQPGHLVGVSDPCCHTV